MDLKQLIEKYTVAGPRYTSYPTAPHWSEALGKKEYRETLSQKVNAGEGPLALYVHVPFCESLCYYCGCNIQITRDHSRSGSYVRSLIKEMESVAKLLGGRRSLTQISWGGGTPTFLSVDEIRLLHAATRAHFEIAPDAEVSLEVDPRVTTDEQLTVLRELGFNRLSLGVQDFDPQVQKAVNRVQPEDLTAAMLRRARELGFRGINFDLIYGLPFQSLHSFEKTIDELLTLRPDRVALYNYAHLPSLRSHQRILDKFPMPAADERVDIFTEAYARLTKAGYHAIGMDHFALETDDMFRALGEGALYRNFMGYTVKKGRDLIGIGASAISDLDSAYFQNIREPKAYEASIEAEGIATLRGCLLSPEDLRRKWVIQALMCRFVLKPEEYGGTFDEAFERHFAEELGRLEPFYQDGILAHKGDRIEVTPLGRLFVRNVAMVFDSYLKAPGKATYSKTV